MEIFTGIFNGLRQRVFQRPSENPALRGIPQILGGVSGAAFFKKLQGTPPF
ncbi:hypothetical protein [Komagataeibacter kakiaceti]